MTRKQQRPAGAAPRRKAKTKTKKRAKAARRTSVAPREAYTNWRGWQPTPQHRALIGVWSDRELADLVGVPEYLIRLRRRQLGIARAKPEPRMQHGPHLPAGGLREPPVWLPLLGVLSDAEIARQHGLTRTRVHQVRKAKGIAKAPARGRKQRPPTGRVKPRLSERMRRTLAAMPTPFTAAQFLEVHGADPGGNHHARLHSLLVSGWISSIGEQRGRQYLLTDRAREELARWPAGDAP